MTVPAIITTAGTRYGIPERNTGRFIAMIPGPIVAEKRSRSTAARLAQSCPAVWTAHAGTSRAYVAGRRMPRRLVARAGAARRTGLQIQRDGTAGLSGETDDPVRVTGDPLLPSVFRPGRPADSCQTRLEKAQIFPVFSSKKISPCRR